MHFPRFTPAPVSARGIAANAGVWLRGKGSSMSVEPKPHPPDPTPPSLLAMPLIPAPLIHTCAWFLRDIWIHSRCCPTFCLYLNTAAATWHAFLPPQQAGLSGAQLDMGYTGVPVPAAKLRLAGTLACLPAGQSLVTGPPPPLPAPVDGIHLMLSPESWMGMLCVLHACGGAYPHLAAAVIDDAPPDDGGTLIPELAELYERVALVTE